MWLRAAPPTPNESLLHAQNEDSRPLRFDDGRVSDVCVGEGGQPAVTRSATSVRCLRESTDRPTNRPTVQGTRAEPHMYAFA